MDIITIYAQNIIKYKKPGWKLVSNQVSIESIHNSFAQKIFTLNKFSRMHRADMFKLLVILIFLSQIESNVIKWTNEQNNYERKRNESHTQAPAV